MAVPDIRLGIDCSEVHHQVITLPLPSNDTYPYGHHPVSHRVGYTIRCYVSERVVRTGLEPVPRGDSLYQLHKVITPCFTCHVTLRGHSMLPKVSYDHLTPMSSHQYVFSIDLSATCTDACPKQRLGSQDRIRTCKQLLDRTPLILSLGGCNALRLPIPPPDYFHCVFLLYFQVLNSLRFHH